MMSAMKFLAPLVLSFFAAMALAGCASTKEEIDIEVLGLDKAFGHHDLVIKAWKSPSFVDGLPEPKLEMLVSGPRQRQERSVKLRAGNCFEGMILERVDVRGDSVGDPKVALAPALTEDFSLKIMDGKPKPYLILRDISGYTFAFYSDIPHPPLR